MGITKTIKSIGELANYVAELMSETGKTYWFRGQIDSRWGVQPSIGRSYSKEDERSFVHRFRTRASSRRNDLPQYYSMGIWLSLMQQFGLPTRLLDWTRSPLIAAYFALEKYIYERNVEQRDAGIWVLDPHELNSSQGYSELTPSIESSLCIELIEPAFEGRLDENEKVFAVMASEYDPRIFVQQGCFTIHSYQNPLETLPQSNDFLSMIIIPGESIPSFARQIDICGFRKGDLFPDLEHLSAELKGSFREWDY